LRLGLGNSRFSPLNCSPTLRAPNGQRFIVAISRDHRLHETGRMTSKDGRLLAAPRTAPRWSSPCESSTLSPSSDDLLQTSADAVEGNSQPRPCGRFSLGTAAERSFCRTFPRTEGPPASSSSSSLTTVRGPTRPRVQPFCTHHLQGGLRHPSICRVPERMMGLEPTTFCMASRRSSQLSYIRASTNYSRGRPRSYSYAMSSSSVPSGSRK
jgi:hypothetical protein